MLSDTARKLLLIINHSVGNGSRSGREWMEGVLIIGQNDKVKSPCWP